MTSSRKARYARVASVSAGLAVLWASLGTVGLVLCALVAAVLWLELFAEAGIGG
jgi:hypothetical protein